MGYSKRGLRMIGASFVAGLMLLASSITGSALAEPEGAFGVFSQCPYASAGTSHCIYSVTEGGAIVLGQKKVPIVNPVTLQGGYTEQVNIFSKMIAAKEGQTFSRAPQSVPGGLLGIVSPNDSSQLVKTLMALLFENGLTGVSATLELARPVNEVLVSELHLAEEQDVVLKLPVKIHLENPFLGPSCYVGSSSSPLIWELTSGVTSPPGPNKPIKGSAGTFEFLEEGRILEAKEAELVDNAWSAPLASGCGGPLSSLVNPAINASIGLPAGKGKNEAILVNTIKISPAAAVRK